MLLPEEKGMTEHWQAWRSQAWVTLRAQVEVWNQRTGGLLSLLGETWQAFEDDDGGTHSAAIGYYALFSLFPLVVLLSLGMTYLVGDTMARIQVMLMVGRYLPNAGALGFVDDIVQNVLASRGTLSVLAFAGTIWG